MNWKKQASRSATTSVLNTASDLSLVATWDFRLHRSNMGLKDFPTGLLS